MVVLAPLSRFRGSRSIQASPLAGRPYQVVADIPELLCFIKPSVTRGNLHIVVLDQLARPQARNVPGEGERWERGRKESPLAQN